MNAFIHSTRGYEGYWPRGNILNQTLHLTILIAPGFVYFPALLLVCLFDAPEPDGACLFNRLALLFRSFFTCSPPAGCVIIIIIFLQTATLPSLHSAHHVIITMVVGTPCAVLTGELWADRMGGYIKHIKYSKPFVCICKHTATQPHTLAGLPTWR